MTAPQIITIAATTETELAKSPFNAMQPSHYESVPGATVYGVNLPAREARNGDYQWFKGDGSTTAFASTAIVNLANAHVDGGSLAAADVLKVVVKVNGTLLHRVAASASPSAGQFKTSGSGPITLTFGAAPADGAKVEVFLSDTVTTVATLTANVAKEAAAYEVLYTSAATQIIRLG